MNVRPERPEDRDASLAIERAAFDTGDEARIVQEVRDAPGSFALVADIGGEIVGHVQLSTAWIGEEEVLALGPVGVAPGRQRAGIGTTLIAAALDEAARRGAPAVILLGDPAYYGPRGFEPAGRYGFTNPFTGVRPDGFEIREEDFQIAVIDHERVRTMAGPVRWHPAFG